MCSMKNNMENTRQQSCSSPTRRKVRFKNNYNNTNNTMKQINSADNNNLNMEMFEQGLDLSLFEGKVDQDLICAICRRVFVQPEVGLCQHVFCSPCLRSNIRQACPTCTLPLDRTPSQKPPVHLRLKLLELVIHCDHKCGVVLPLGKLPRHVRDECPNTPVQCPHTKKGGCKMKVKRCQLQEHIKECDWRPVECDACGEKTLFNELVQHQKKSRCVENRIKNQLVQAIKTTNQEVKKHRKNLEHQRVKIDTHQRRNEIDHVRRLQSMKLQQRQATWQSNHKYHHHQQQPSNSLSSSFNDYSNSSSKNSNYHNFSTDNKQQQRQRQNMVSSLNPKLVPKSQSAQQRNGNNNDDCSGVNDMNNDVNNNTVTNPIIDYHNPVNIFVTGAEYATDDETDNVNGTYSKPPSRGIHNPETQFTCIKCNKRVRESCNKANSCRWHAGPIIELFGGTCYTCGRLDYQHGCLIGHHEM